MRIAICICPSILRALTDMQMLQFMGRENLEDYNADFLVMLETWEAGIRFLVKTASYSDLGAMAPKDAQDLEIARLLGWRITTRIF